MSETENSEPSNGSRLLALYHAHHDKLWVLGDQVMVSAVNFLTIAAVAKALGLQGFGLFAWAHIVFLFFKAVHIALIVSPMMSLGPKQKPEDQGAYFGTIVVHQLVLAAVTLALIPLVLLSFALIDPEIDLRWMSAALVAATIGDQVQDFVRRYLFTKSRVLAAFANDVIAYLLRLAILVALPFALGVALDGALAFWIMAGTSFLAAAIGFLWFEPLRFERIAMVRVSRSHWDFSKWLFGMGVLQFCSGHAIVMVAGLVLGATAVGAIRSTMNILAPIQVFTLALQNIAPVRASSLFKDEGAPALNAYLSKLASAGLVASFAIAVIGWVFAEEIVELLYGPEFVPYAWLVNWWVVIFTIRYLQFPLEVGLRSIEYTKPLFITVTIEAVFGLGMAYFLAQWFGLQGTMFGLVIAHIIPVTVLSILFFRRIGRMADDRLAPKPS